MLRKQKQYRLPIIGILAVFIVSTFASFLLPFAQNTNALTNSQMTLDQRVESYVTLNALRLCVQNESKQQIDTESIWGIGAFAYWPYIKAENASAGNWWKDDAKRVGSYLNTGANTNDSGGDGKSTCNQILQTGLQLWGYSNGLDLLCDAKINRNDGSPCREGADKFGSLASHASKIYDAVKEKVYGGNTPSLYEKIHPTEDKNGYPGRYLIYRAAFERGCVASPSRSSASKEYLYENIKVVNSDGTVDDTRYIAGVSRSTTRSTYTDRDDLRVIEKSCEQIAKEMNDYAADYAAYRKMNTKEETTGGSGAGDAKCGSDPSAPGCDVDTTTDCTVEGIGWMVCPVITFFAKMTDLLWGWISNFLKAQPVNTNTGASDNTMYNAWTAMRNLANVAFVIAFIIIVYSQLTGMGVSNYGVKKMLPRLIVAAILVNLSYWVAAIAVDISNILGVSIYNILRNGIGIGDVTVEVNAWEGLATFLLSGGTIAAGVVGFPLIISNISGFAPVALYAFIVFVLVVALALIVAFVILAVRQALIIILIVLSPLAFVAMILPNTEKFFSLWRKSLTTMLIFYPLFALLFGGSYIAGMIIVGSATETNSNGENSASIITVVIGMAVTAVPLFLTPLLIRFSSGILGQVAGMVNNKNRGLIDRLRNTRNRKARLAMGESLNNPKRQRNPFTRVARRIQASSRNDEQRQKIIDADNKSAYLNPSNAKGAKLAQGVANAELMSATLEAELKADIELGKERTQSGVIIRQKAAEQSVKATHARSDANFEELKSSSQALPTGDAAVRNAVANARSSQQALNIAQGRQRSAESILQQEYTDTLLSNESVARAAGGIDPNGRSRAVAQAIDAQHRAHEANVAAFATMHKENRTSAGVIEDGISARALDVIARSEGTYSSEEREAASRGVIESGDIDVIKPHLEYLATAAANASSEQERETIINLQKSAGERIGRSPGKPIGIGAPEIAQLKQGTYEIGTPQHKESTALTQEQSTLLSTAMGVQTYNTVVNKGIAAQGWASIDKADIGDITKLVSSGVIPQSRMETLRSSIHTALSDPRIKNQIKERETDLLRQLERELNGKLPKSSRSNSATDGELPIDHGDTK